jgi:prepilin-type N-terminal cleavage/methylation domain-containing protein
MKTHIRRTGRTRAGFSLVELTIVVLVLGVLATFAVPRFMTAVERAKASEAFSYLSEIGSAQSRHNARTGEYSPVLADLDVELSAPVNFAVASPVSGDWEVEWELTLTRVGPASGYSPYSVVFDENGFDAVASTIPAELIPFD